MKTLSGILAAAALAAGVCQAAEKPPATETEKMNYAVGYQLGGDFKRQGIELDAESMIQGIRDSAAGTAPRIDMAEMQKTLFKLKSKATAADQQRKSAQYAADAKEGKAFLEANAGKPGVVSLAGGMQMKTVREGNGKSAGPHDNVSVHYTGTLVNGSEFFTTRKAEGPTSIRVGALLPGLREAVLRMKAGGRAIAFVPPALGYSGGHPLFGKTLVFDVELLSVD